MTNPSTRETAEVELRAAAVACQPQADLRNFDRPIGGAFACTRRGRRVYEAEILSDVRFSLSVGRKPSESRVRKMLLVNGRIVWDAAYRVLGSKS